MPLLKAETHLYFKMTFFNDHFLIKKNKISVQIRYWLKNDILKKVFHSKHEPWRRACCCFRCLYIRKEEKKKKEKKRSTWIKPWLTRIDALGFYNMLMYKLRTEDADEYTRFLRIPPYLFKEARVVNMKLGFMGWLSL